MYFCSFIHRRKTLSTYHAWVILPSWCSGKESACQCRRLKRYSFDPCVGLPPIPVSSPLITVKDDSGPTSALIPWTKFSGATWSLLSLAPNLPPQLFISTVPDVVPIGILSVVSLFLKVSSWYHQPVKFSLYYQNRGP